MNRRLIALFVVCVAVLSGCTDDSGPKEAEQVAFKGVPKVKVPKVKSNLSVSSIDRCIRDEPLDPSEITTAASPTEWVATQVREIRGLDYSATNNVAIVDSKEFADLVGKQQDELELQEDRAARSLAWSFGLIPHGLDLNYFLRGTGAEMIAGFYDPRTKDIVVEAKDELSSKALITLSHEMTHAATDQLLRIPKQKPGHLINDASLANRSFVEGDAALVQLRFVSRFVPAKVVDKAIKPHVSYAGEYKRERDYGVPHLMIDDFIFPYQWGLAFVCSVFEAQGWEGVNRLYKHPVKSTSQVMFPERYLKGEKLIKPAKLPALNKPWEVQTSGDIGAAQLKQLFEAPGDVGKRSLDDPLARASSLSDGAFTLWVNEEENESPTVTAVSLSERKQNPGLLCNSMHKWYRKTFFDATSEVIADGVVAYEDEAQQAVISCDGRDIRMGIAQTIELAEQAIGLGAEEA